MADIFNLDRSIGIVGYILNKLDCKTASLRWLYNFIYLLDREALLKHACTETGDSYYIKYCSFVPRIINNLFNWHDSQASIWHEFFDTVPTEGFRTAYMKVNPGNGHISRYIQSTLDKIFDDYLKRTNPENEDDYIDQADYMATLPEYRNLMILGTHVNLSITNLLKFNKKVELLESYKENKRIAHVAASLKNRLFVDDYLASNVTIKKEK